MIFENADAAGLGVFRAARETRWALVFGSNGDQTAVAPDVILRSVGIDLPHAFLAVARAVKAGRFSPTASLDLTMDTVRLALNPAFVSPIRAPVRSRVDSLWQLLRASRTPVPTSNSIATRSP